MATFLQRKVTGYHNRPTMAGLLLVAGSLALAWVLATGRCQAAALLAFGGGAMLLVVRFPWLAWISWRLRCHSAAPLTLAALASRIYIIAGAGHLVRRRRAPPVVAVDASALAALTPIYVARQATRR
ncbi:MAG: hypothetical protein R2856_39420 [Caldilineaceae bacterium]